jgi:predicted O-methyltransferase YrrM
VKTFISEEIADYAQDHTRAEPKLLIDLIAQTQALMDSPQMLTGRVEGRFLKLLVQILQPHLIVEVGMFTGYSALSMAEGLPADGKIITCDIDPKARDMAQAAFDASPVGHKIEIRMGPAINTLRQLKQSIDFSFIDADKKAYPVYYEEILARTRPGGLILMDNMFLSGRVLDPQDDAAKAVAKLNDDIARDARVENVLLTLRDGVQMIRKK